MSQVKRGREEQALSGRRIVCVRLAARTRQFIGKETLIASITAFLNTSGGSRQVAVNGSISIRVGTEGTL